LQEIAPYQTKTMMKARMIAAREHRATAYIAIKADVADATSQCVHLPSSHVD
jgi:hypothetical protein